MSSMPDVDPEAVRKELFGLAGYSNGTRFFKQGMDPKDAQMQQMSQAMQQLQQQLGMAQQELQQVKANKMGDTASKLADVDLKQAQTVKTLYEAAIMPSQALMQQAVEPQGA
jgi:cysteinyl-tRNA synthetase